MIDCGESDNMIKISGKMDKSDNGLEGRKRSHYGLLFWHDKSKRLEQAPYSIPDVPSTMAQTFVGD